MTFNYQQAARTVHQWLSPVANIPGLVRSLGALFSYPGFIIEYFRYRRQSTETVLLGDVYPCLNDRKSASQSGRGHYFYQDIWALARIFERMPLKHVDVGSRIDGFAGQLSAFSQVEYIDIRPVELGVDRFTMVEGSILNLPYADSSISSLSCLHVIEHIGLGRYGDPVDPQGSEKASRELVRVLAKGGWLIVGIPVGRERVAFNAHRIFSPLTVIEWFSELKLVEFSVVTDGGQFRRFAAPRDYINADYACGLYLFRRAA